MPFIDSKITVPVSPEKRENIKSQFGEAVGIFHKPESYLMVGFEDNYDLYMGGEKVEKGAFVSVNLYGNASSDACNEMTGKICSIFEKELGIPGDKVYISYQGYKDWGWNGRNF